MHEEDKMLKDIKNWRGNEFKRKKSHISRNREKSTSELKVTTFLQYEFFEIIRNKSMVKLQNVH